MSYKSITDEEFEEMTEGPDYNTIENKIVDQGRWSTYHEKIVLHLPTSKYYSITYTTGSTEYQDYQELEAMMAEVVPKEVTTTIYEMKT